MSIKRVINKLFYKPKIKIYGKDNNIQLSKNATTKRLNISVYGNNNLIFIAEDSYIHNTRIILGFPNSPVNNCSIKIGKSTTINSLLIQVGENNSNIEIGKDCMFSFGIEINCTDHHAIFNKNNQLINQGNYVKIGDHVWICKEVRIMKNSVIPSGCVAAQRSIITKNFTVKNSILAGNPAKIVKEDIIWDRKRPNEFI